MPLPSVFQDGKNDIIYVTAKRYKRILKRREQRTKIEKRFKALAKMVKPKPAKKRGPIHQSRSNLAQRRERDKNGKFIPKADKSKGPKVKCVRGRKSKLYKDLMAKYEAEGNLEKIEALKVHGTKNLDKFSQ